MSPKNPMPRLACLSLSTLLIAVVSLSRPALAADPWLDGLQRRPVASPSPETSAPTELDWYRTQLKAFPNQALLHYQFALRLHQLGESGLAEAAYREALRLNPDLRGASYHLAALLQDRPEAAQQVLDQALDRWVADPDLHYALGLTYERLNQPRAALTAYHRALALSPQHEAAARLAQLEQSAAVEATPDKPLAAIAALFKQGKAEPAWAQLRTLLRNFPTHLPAYELMIAQLEATGKNKDAALWREQLELVSPCRGDNRFRLGRYYYWAGYGDQALGLLNAQQQCRPGAETARLLAQIQRERQQPDQALATLQQAIARWPADSALQAALAQMSLDLGRYPQAQAALTPLLKRKPVPPEAWYVQGQLQARAGNSAAAIASFKQALALSARPEYRKALALAYLRAGMSQPAHKELQLYLKARPAEAAALQPLLDQLAAQKPRGKF